MILYYYISSVSVCVGGVAGTAVVMAEVDRICFVALFLVLPNVF